MIRMVKLGGADVVAEVTENDDGSFTLDNPMLTRLVKDEAGNMGVGLAPFLPLAKGNSVTIAKSFVICVYEPAQEIEDQFRQHFGSGLVIPRNQLLKG